MSRGWAALGRAGLRSQRRRDVGFAVASCAVLAVYNNAAGMLPWHRRRYTLVNVCATGAALVAAAASGLTATDVGLGSEELAPGRRLGSAAAAASAVPVAHALSTGYHRRCHGRMPATLYAARTAHDAIANTTSPRRRDPGPAACLWPTRQPPGWTRPVS